MSITITARQIRPGDVIDFGGQPMTVMRSEPHPDPERVSDLWYLHIVDPWYAAQYGDHGTQLGVRADAVYAVQRPDADEALVEAAARAMCAAEAEAGFPDWEYRDDDDRDAYRRLARAAVIACREAEAVPA